MLSVAGSFGQVRVPPARFVEWKLIGKGGYGCVYKCCDGDNGYRPVAIKMMGWDEMMNGAGIPQNILRELSICQALRHQNIVEILDVLPFPEMKSIYLVFELMDMDLARFIQQSIGGISIYHLKSFLYQLLTGLDHCHYRGVLHRDLKPANLLINIRTNCLKLADFGMARKHSLNHAGCLEVCTLWYRAPEILLGSTSYGCEIDIWSVGCIFGEMASRCPLFAGECQIHQLYTIFKIMGTVNETVWPGVTSLPNYNQLFPKWQKKLLRVALPEIEDSGIKLLELLLCYNPKRRTTACKAMKHKFFSRTI